MTRSRIHLAVHAVLVLVIDALALLLLSELLPGFVLDGPAAALGTALVIGLLNALVWPTLARLTVRISVLTFGLSALLLNAALVALAVVIVPGAEMEGAGEAILVTILITVLTATISALIAIDDDDSWYLNVVARQMRRREDWEESDVPGVLFCEIDGLAHEVLRRGLANGAAPSLSRWMREGSHRLRGWETDLSSQTGACQAGILHGNNAEMPAFRWWEKKSGRAMVSNHPRDAAELESRCSDGRGLLHAGGASRANLFSGDAPHSMLTLSNVLERRGRLGRDYASYFARPYAVIRTAALSVADMIAERRAAGRQRRIGVWPRIARSRSYALVRAFATVVQLDLQVAAVVGDLLAGRPVIYTTFLAYDEVAHHSGVERPDALAVLRRIDRQIDRLERVAREAPRPYRLVVLSDHGQSQGATFRERYGETLEELVRGAAESGAVLAESGGDDDALAYLQAGLSESGAENSRTGRRVVAAGERYGGGPAADGEPEISVMASGCLGLICFPRLPGRVSLEQIEELHPRLIERLRSHPGIGFVLAQSERYGALALGPSGVHQLEHDRIEGEDPLAPYGPNARHHLLRTTGFANCPDLLVNSAYWAEIDEVAAFEELVGSHGGLGGGQSHPFVLHPEDLDWPAGEVVGAECLHTIFTGWLHDLGQPGWADRPRGAGDADGANRARVGVNLRGAGAAPAGGPPG